MGPLRFLGFGFSIGMKVFDGISTKSFLTNASNFPLISFVSSLLAAFSFISRMVCSIRLLAS